MSWASAGELGATEPMTRGFLANLESQENMRG
jgi:hypothetical protein